VREHGEESDEFFSMQKDKQFIDTPLHPIGVLQCEANSGAVHCLNAKYVLVSPMMRAMQTCVGMFKDHPRVANIKFIVVPILREILHTVCDVPCCARELV